jgi:hypothetical protein
MGLQWKYTSCRVNCTFDVGGMDFIYAQKQLTNNWGQVGYSGYDRFRQSNLVVG